MSDELIERMPRAPTRRVAIMIGAIALSATAVVVARRYTRPPPPEDIPAPGMAVGSDSITLAKDAPMWSVVKIAPASPSSPRWSDPVPAKIVFDESRTSRVGAPLAGRVTAVYVERGQHVVQGAKLFAVASPNLAELRSELEKNRVEATTAKINRDRVTALVEAGSIPAKELLTAQQQVTEAELALKLSNQKLASLKVTSGGDAGFTVTAPRDGVVVEKNLAVGQNLDPTAGTVMAIADLVEVWVVADLFETDVGRLAPGAKAKVMLDGARELEGTVDQVSAIVDPDRHTVPVRVRLANPDGALRPNSYAQIRFFDPTAAVASLPAGAVVFDGTRTYVYVKDKTTGELKRRTILVGPPNASEVPVLSGLAPGEPVVVQGAILLDNQIQLDDG